MRSTTEHPRPRKVVMLAYDRAKLLDIAGPLQVFHDARLSDGAPAYETVLASESGEGVETDTGIKLSTVALQKIDFATVDTLLVTGCDLGIVPLGSIDLLRGDLRQRLKQPRRLGSICTGAFILAELGVLEGVQATTHWCFAEQLAQDYPAIAVKPDALYTVSGRVWTSGGVSAGIDMALAMVEEDLGYSAALELARTLVWFLKRPGGQLQFKSEKSKTSPDRRFAELRSWMKAHLTGDLSVPALAEAAGMSPRNFARVFLRETGESPARAVERLRLEAAVELLESSRTSIELLAQQTGFGDDERLRRAFVKAYGVSPQDYRSRFGRPQGCPSE